MPIIVTPRLKDRLQELGISTLRECPFDLPADCRFEPPCALKWMKADHRLSLGAFSYAVSGYLFAADIGRYTSIGEDVQIGRGSHPVSWASTSPVFYQRHQDVLDLQHSQAASFQITAPYIAPKTTTIGNDVYIGHGAFIIQGVTIGDGAVIGARAVVTRNVPPFAVVAGSPASIRRMRFPDALIARMARVAWWRFAFWDLEQAPVHDPERFLDMVEARVDWGLSEYRPAMVDLRDIADDGS